jgi:hypothetical protein
VSSATTWRQGFVSRARAESGWIIGGSLASALVAILAVSLALGASEENQIALLLYPVSAALAATIVVAFVRARRRGEATALLHPLVLPLAYIGYALLIPQIYMLTSGRGIASIPFDSLSVASVQVMCYTVIGYILGAAVTLALWRRTSPPFGPIKKVPSSESIGAKTIADTGRLILFMSLAAKLYQVATRGSVFTSAYGADQLSYDQTTAIGIIGEALIPVGCLALMYGNSRLSRRPLRGPDWVILATVLFISVVLLGSRAEAIAPAALFLWFRLLYGKRLTVRALAIATAALGTVFLIISRLRAPTGGATYSLLEQLLWQTSSPQLLTGVVTALVPERVGFFSGSTYAAALQYSLPGPISRALFGDVAGTGTLVYRDLAGVTSVNQGYGFALPTEAYLNFGNAGVAIIAILIGASFAIAYRWASDSSRGLALGSFVYPLLISYLPYGLRTDFLSQFKSVVYPLVITALLIAIAREFSKNKSHDKAPRGFLA